MVHNNSGSYYLLCRISIFVCVTLNFELDESVFSKSVTHADSIDPALESVTFECIVPCDRKEYNKCACVILYVANCSQNSSLRNQYKFSSIPIAAKKRIYSRDAI